jgi:hypothetical protein
MMRSYLRKLASYGNEYMHDVKFVCKSTHTPVDRIGVTTKLLEHSHRHPQEYSKSSTEYSSVSHKFSKNKTLY